MHEVPITNPFQLKKTRHFVLDLVISCPDQKGPDLVGLVGLVAFHPNRWIHPAEAEGQRTSAFRLLHRRCF